MFCCNLISKFGKEEQLREVQAVALFFWRMNKFLWYKKSYDCTVLHEIIVLFFLWSSWEPARVNDDGLTSWFLPLISCCSRWCLLSVCWSNNGGPRGRNYRQTQDLQDLHDLQEPIVDVAHFYHYNLAAKCKQARRSSQTRGRKQLWLWIIH